MTQPEAVFNPFKIFDREVARKFLILPRYRVNLSSEQLEEMVPHSLRTFRIDGNTWFLAKDVCSFLGITPDHSSRALNSIEPNYVFKRRVKIDVSPQCGDTSRTSTYTGEQYLVNEPGVYALIQKSRTVYAIEFKKWLNEEVLPVIRTQGSYILSEEKKEEVEDINAELEMREYEAECKSPSEVEAEFREILEEKDRIIEEKEEIIVDQQATIEKKDKQHDELISLLSGIQDSMSSMNQKMTRLETHNENLTRTINTIRDVVVKDRIATPADDGKGNVFAIISTHRDNPQEHQYPYTTIKCQKKHLNTNFRKKKGEYPEAEIVFQIPNPSADKMFDCLKERVRANELEVTFYHSSFRLGDGVQINQLIDIVNEIERERVRID